VDGRTYPLRSAHIRAHAEGGLAQSTLIQEFANPYEEPLEVIYTMPLPADGAVLGYTIRIGERVIRGEIEPRDQVEATYKEALYSGRTAALLEQDRADTFRRRLGNVPPRTDVRVEIDVFHPLSSLAAVDEAGPL
jgi:Ca-activated chloride channel family protein